MIYDMGQRLLVFRPSLVIFPDFSPNPLATSHSTFTPSKGKIAQLDPVESQINVNIDIGHIIWLAKR